MVSSDTYDIYYKQPGLQPTTHIAASEYPSVKARTLPDSQTATIEDIFDFIVEYINSDVLVRARLLRLSSKVTYDYVQGLLADRHLTLAGKLSNPSYSTGPFHTACRSEQRRNQRQRLHEGNVRPPHGSWQYIDVFRSL